jgi:hypothetical protein
MTYYSPGGLKYQFIDKGVADWYEGVWYYDHKMNMGAITPHQVYMNGLALVREGTHGLPPASVYAFGAAIGEFGTSQGGGQNPPGASGGNWWDNLLPNFPSFSLPTGSPLINIDLMPIALVLGAAYVLGRK